jgi:hypothetical protein
MRATLDRHVRKSSSTQSPSSAHLNRDPVGSGRTRVADPEGCRPALSSALISATSPGRGPALSPRRASQACSRLPGNAQTEASATVASSHTVARVASGLEVANFPCVRPLLRARVSPASGDESRRAHRRKRGGAAASRTPGGTYAPARTPRQAVAAPAAAVALGLGPKRASGYGSPDSSDPLNACVRSSTESRRPATKLPGFSSPLIGKVRSRNPPR